MVDWNPFSDSSWDEPEALGGSGRRKSSSKAPKRKPEPPLHGFSGLKPALKELPQSSAAASSPKLAEPVQLRPGVKRVLVIDDNVMVRRNHKSFLERMGFDVCEAVDGKNGIDKMLHYGPESFSLVIVDLNMPVMNGDVFVAKAREKFKDSMPPVWVCTVNADAQTVTSLLAQGIDGYLLKPVQLRVFATKLQALFPDLELNVP